MRLAKARYGRLAQPIALDLHIVNRTFSAFRVFACCVIAIGVIQQWQYVGTDRWWIAYGGGVALGFTYAVDRSLGLFFAAMAFVLVIAGLLGAGDGMEISNRVLFSALAVGMLTGLTLSWGARRLLRYFGRRQPD